MTTVADRRVTASPENAATDAPVNAAAPAISRNVTNGSARTATNAARTSAETGSHASSGSGARPGRRRSQAAASMAAVRTGRLRPKAGPSSAMSARTPIARAASRMRRARERSMGSPRGDAVGAGTTPGALVWRRRARPPEPWPCRARRADAARSIGSWAPRRSMTMRTIRPSIARIALIASIGVFARGLWRELPRPRTSVPSGAPSATTDGARARATLSGQGGAIPPPARRPPHPSPRTASERPSTTRRSSGPARSSSRSRMSRRPSSRPATASAPWAATSAHPRPRTSKTSRTPPSPTGSRPTAGKTRSTCCASLNGLTSKVVGEQTQAVEVTGQVIDLEARIRNLRASETALQEIASTATRITDVLEVQNQLTNVRGQIEQLSAALADLEDRAGFATLTATFSVPVVAVEARRRGLRARQGRGRGDRQPGEHPAGADDGRDLVRDRVAAACCSCSARSSRSSCGSAGGWASSAARRGADVPLAG